MRAGGMKATISLLVSVLVGCSSDSTDIGLDGAPLPDLVGAADQANEPDGQIGGPCHGDGDCTPSAYCRLAEDRCILHTRAPVQGVCTARPASCAGSTDPLCACQGLSLVWDTTKNSPPPTVETNPLLQQYVWAKKVAVDLSAPAGQQKTTAYAGMALQRKSETGTAHLLFPLPRVTPPHQRMTTGGLRLMLVKESGEELEPAAVAASAVDEVAVVFVPADFSHKRMLRISWDLSRLPKLYILRWALDLELQNRSADLSAPVKLDALDHAPAEAKAWLKPAPMIQSDDAEIKALAAKVRGDATTVQELIAGLLGEMAKIRKPTPTTPVAFQNDALSFLKTGIGDCVANANLFAALARAAGVPCRVVNQIMRGKEGQNMHYVNEYYVPPVGWVLVEPQAQQIQWTYGQLVDMGVVHPELEKSGKGFMSYDGIQQLTMIGQQVDDQGEPLAPSARTVDIAPALIVANSTRAWLCIHGAP
jgi:hypothetical protein